MSGVQDILLIEPIGAHGLLLRLNRPEKRNALATDLLGGVADALDAAAADPAIRAVVITGADRFFAAGADINELASRDTGGALADPRPAIWMRIRGFSKPLIAAVEGWSLGAGNELAMCCDLVVAGKGRNSASPKPISASFPVPAAPRSCPGWSGAAGRCGWCCWAIRCPPPKRCKRASLHK